MNKLKQNWKIFRNKAFPKSYTGKEIDGIDMVLLDAESAGCIDYFIVNNSLNPERLEILKSCRNDLEKVTSQLEGEGKEYFLFLMQLTESILNKILKGSISVTNVDYE